MAKKILISLAERNLLIFSDVLQRVEPELYCFLEKNKRVYPNMIEDQFLINKIQKNLANWLTLSIQEWDVDRKGPTISDEYKYRCELCNQPIKVRYKVTNKKNGKNIFIGGDCTANFKELATMKKIVKSEEELFRYNELLDKYPKIYNLLTNKNDFLESTDIIIPDYYQKSYEKALKKLMSFLKKYIRYGGILQDQELEHLIKVYKNEVKAINKFVSDNIFKKDVLSRKIANSIKRIQEDEYSFILNEVSRNKGRINPAIASKIKVPKYLNSLIERINKILPNDVSLIDSRIGTYDLTLKKKRVSYKFAISSEIVISSYFDNSLRSFELWISEHLGDLRVNYADKYKLLRLAESYLERVNDIEVLELNFRRILNNEFDGLTPEERAIVYEKLSGLESKYTALIFRGSTSVHVFKQNKILDMGKK